ncbi:bifunctional DNA-formamidopyrimidine glycosylase/DNA-(apurinic or apyrimidinic site) lyase [Candidatus Saccharibacteria bacterium]|jgi:formamidopyrimidine-DNA glycosylase|nr:bifunctional DNA-formamidopyrimidine glycosylase/DNA-(apurinic or apyrimidinic site) lyase [Candidatus Saccharibacteria bacterium]NCU43365.1 bifunctional DNA-formamidopyrimidine glycosylase/DNA-(apurinic or apyrimidinic site) lyase [Candidatus Saccharibacteria bacterium]
MPELPEVETVARGLRRLIVGKNIVKVSHDNAKSFPNSLVEVNNFMVGANIGGVRRRAKVIIIDLDDSWSLVAHLKMTGQMVYRGEENWGAGHPNDDFLAELPVRATRVQIEFSDGSKLFFNDQRKFGWMKLLPTAEIKNMPFFIKVGPEPLEDSFTLENFIDRFKRKKRSAIKAALLDQSVIAGVGNIYADESLWRAQIHPETRVESLDSSEFKRLYEAVRYVMNLSIEKGGSTARNYVNADGGKGNYLDYANVFRKEGSLCARCGSEIIKTRVAGRGTHICPVCQKVKA